MKFCCLKNVDARACQALNIPSLLNMSIYISYNTAQSHHVTALPCVKQRLNLSAQSISIRGLSTVELEVLSKAMVPLDGL